MADYDILIKGGTIVDGTRTPRYKGDLAIKDGRIARIGGVRSSTADKVLDASGLYVVPGFVDLHTHYDAQIQWDPYCTLSGWHGVTSVVIGNCGFGFAPCHEEDRDRSMLTLTRNEAIPYAAMQHGMLWDWLTFPEFLDTLDRIPKGVNVLPYQALTPLFSWVMGWDEAKKRRPTEKELKEMHRLLDVAMDAGACGWSAQVLGPDSIQRDFDGTPMITDLMTDEELLSFARVLSDRDEGFIELSYGKDVAHNEAGELGKLRFYEQVAEAANRPVLFQMIQVYDHDPSIHRGRLSWLEECAQKGLRMYGQGFISRNPFELTFEEWNLFDDSPAWRKATMGSVEERKKKMQNIELRAEMKAEWDSGLKPGSGLFVGSLEGLVVGEVGNQKFEHYIGEKCGDIAAKEGKHIVDTVLDLTLADNLQTEFMAPLGRTDPVHTAEILKSPFTVPGVSDGGAHVKFYTGANYPTDTLIWQVRDEGQLTLEEAHYKLSYMPAFCAGFRNRGLLREGAPADILVYDLDNLTLGPTEIAHDLPGDEWRRIQKAEGYRWTIVNGEITLEDGEPTGATSGRLLRHGRG